MVIINKSNNTDRPIIQIIGSDEDEVRRFSWFFENRGAITEAPPVEMIGPDYVCQFSCAWDRLVAAYEVSFDFDWPAGKRLRKMAAEKLLPMARQYALNRIAELGQMREIVFGQTALGTYAIGTLD